jgi:hypothetical protein
MSTFRRTNLFVVLTAAALLLAAHPAWSHHSFAAEFDINKPVTLTGVLTRMEWVNPHGWMHIDVKTAEGALEHWSVETGGPTQLLRRGFEKNDFAAGVEVTVKGYRARDGSLTAHGESAMLKDGRSFFIGEIAIN